MLATIKLNELLNYWDALKSGDIETCFSISFITKNGERKYYNRAVKTGANMNLKDNEMRGCIPVDAEGKTIGHYTAINIWRIVEFNSKQIVL